MDNMKKDRRFKRTQQQLLIALKELINTKNIVDISVRELAELADVNRATFYLHYRDPYDMLEQLGNEFIENMKNILIKDNASFNPAKSFVNLYKFVKENYDIAYILFSPNCDSSFGRHLEKSLEKFCFDSWIVRAKDDDSRHCDYFSVYLVAGIKALLEKWIFDGFVETPEEMAKLSQYFMMYGGKQFWE